MHIIPFKEPLHASFLRMLWKLTGRSRALDTYLCSFLKFREFLPVRPPEELIPDYLSSTVTITTPPHGPWATPAIDTLTLLKAVKGFRSKRILEIGSYKGTTALLLAQNSESDARVFALDKDPAHGSAYRGKPEEVKITRIVGDSSLENIKPHGPFDFIFVDGDHSRKGAYHDSLVALECLADDGVIFWHDYHNRGYFVHRQGAVPEALRLIGDLQKVPMIAIEGTMIAMYSRSSSWETQPRI